MDALSLLMFPSLILLVLLGFHVGFAMMGVAFIFGLFTFGDAVIYQFVEKIDSVATSFILAAVPLFIFMGAMLERTGIAARLFEALRLWTHRLPGGLAIGTILMCVIFAATAGVVGATEAVVGLLAIPVMLKYGYDKRLISGTICAGGSLGTVIPPSITVIILGPVANVPVGNLFAGMIGPGFLMALFYLLYIVILATLRPDLAPRLKSDEMSISLAKKLRLTATALLPPLFLITAVLGAIIFGVAAPTEAAAMGALATIILAWVHKGLNRIVLKEALLKTLKITCMILLIVLGGNMFAGVFIGSGGLSITQDLLGAGGLNAPLVLFLILSVAFVMGFVLDWISIILIIIPVAMPLLLGLDVDPLWFCILFLIVIQTSYLTPPLAPAIFYLRGIAPKEIELSDMFRGVIPFIVLHFIVMAVIIVFPALVVWLPGKLLG